MSFNARKDSVIPAAPYPPLISAAHRSSSVLRTDDSSTRAGAANERRGGIAQVQFCRWDVLGCINCVHGDRLAGVKGQAASAAVPQRKLGPSLLELKRLEIQPNGGSSLFSTTSIFQSRGNPSLGTSISSTCLDVKHSDESAATSSTILAATGLTTGALCLHSFDDNSESSSIDYYQLPRIHRPATAVAWGSTHVAIGLTGSGTESRQTPRGGGGLNTGHQRSSHHNNNNGGNAGDRDYCCFVWDVEHQQQQQPQQSATPLRNNRRYTTKSTTPLYKLAHQSGVASLAWIDNRQQTTLIVGGEQRNLHLCDLRVAATSNITSNNPPPVAVYAHNFGVHGVEVDPNRPWLFATFSKAAGEVVKLWDIRRMDSSLTEIKIAGASLSATAAPKSKATTESSNSLSSLPNASAVVSALKWSALDPGHLSILVGDTVHEYDTSVPGSRPAHTNTVRSRVGILNFCHYPFRATERSAEVANNAVGKIDQKRQFSEEMFSKRVVVVGGDRTVSDISTHRLAPLAISQRTGQLIHGLGRTLWSGSPSKGTSAMENPTISIDEDISATMMRRARCLHVAKYSMDTTSNIKMLAGEALRLDGEATTTTCRDQLLRLWRWVQRTEALCAEALADDTWEDVANFPAKGLVDAGALQLLELYKGQPEVQSYSESLYCATYDSEGRRAALTSCGWAGKFDLDSVMADCEEGGEFERSSALAVWHGDIGAAVDALQRGAEYYAAKNSPYAETLELVSLSIAGYRGGDNESASSRVWRKACSKLLQRADLSSVGSRIASGAGYLRHVLRFLVKIGVDDTHEDVLGDSMLSLCDRVAFACRFLAATDLKAFLDRCISDCEVTGNVEGISITGIEKKGIQILQVYVDNSADVQTAALLTSRVIFAAEWTTERRVALEWLHAYRSLLNCWQMWQSRAMFDVDRAELLRKVKMRQQVDSVAGSKVAGRRLPPGRRQGIRPPDPDVQATIPAQLDARCNYCSASLGLRRQDNNVNQWLSKMKNVLSCCPQCRKPLPRCAICMLSLGALNPYTELTKDRSRLGPDDLSSMANLPFAEWFTWCMRCKHGGHAHHLVGWFANQATCPVSGCNCQCQFDGIHKLARTLPSNNGGAGVTTDKNPP